MIQLQIKALELVENSPFVRVTLQDISGPRDLRIWIGIQEAAAIQAHLQGEKTPRPLTHDLMTTILSMLQASVVQVLISDMRDDTFFAIMSITVDGRILEVDCRPSDVIALAVRFDAPILIQEDLLTRIEQTEEEQAPRSPHPGAILVEREDTTIH